MRRATYGFDAPGIMSTFLGLGAALIAASLPISTLAPGGWRVVGAVLLVLALVPLTLGCVMFGYGLFGKHRMRDFMMSRISWRGDEQVLDIGAGRGLLLIAAARKLRPGGRAVGIDIWRAQDLSGNSLAALRANVEAVGVADQVELLTQDARKMDFADASFDVVLSLYCLHNIEDEAERRGALREVARVLKPGGRALIGEFMPTHAYAAPLREAGLDIVFSRAFFGVALGPMWMIEAVKPSRA